MAVLLYKFAGILQQLCNNTFARAGESHGLKYVVAADDQYNVPSEIEAPRRWAD